MGERFYTRIERERVGKREKDSDIRRNGCFLFGNIGERDKEEKRQQ